ncbi:MAG TPA: N-acetylmuramidase domain-containing protein [Caulobacterales bacterium]|nr:N-acetylmuramidase domain-containing protein [Caulobacterales bacterium]
MGLFGVGRSKAVVQDASEPAVALRAAAAAPFSNPLGLPEFLARLAAGDRDRLTNAAVDVAAKRLGVAVPVMRALVAAEAAGREGFGIVHLPTMKFEPAVFSRLTGGRYDHSNPDISYPLADDRRLPASPALRWRQLAKAYVMNNEAALKAAAWGMFALRGEDHEDYGFTSAASMAASLAESEERQLAALEEWLRRRRAAGLLKARNWAAYGALRDPAEGRALAGRLYRGYRALTDKKRRLL